MIYIYGFIGSAALAEISGVWQTVAGLSGIDEAPVTLLSCGNCCALISSTTGAPIAITDTHLWQHEEVLERLAAQTALLPARFGTLLHTERELCDLVTANAASFTANLARVDGRDELSLRVMWDDERPEAVDGAKIAGVERKTPGLSGTEYMRARLLEEQAVKAWRERGQVIVDWVNAALTPHSVDYTMKVLAKPRLLMTAAYLVERAKVGLFREQVAQLAACESMVNASRLRFLCTGPWPAYNFVDIQLALPESAPERH